MSVTSLCLLSVLAQAPTPQQPTTVAGPTTVAELATRVEQAHRPAGPVPPVTALRGDLELHLLDPTAEQRGQVDLAVRFLEAALPGSTKVRPLIRYEVRDTGTPIVRGRDRFGPWQLFQGEPKDLTGPSFVADLEQCERHTNLARQLVRFLSPGDVLRALQRPSAVGEEALAFVRNRAKVDCLTVSGELASFPLLQQGGDDAPVHLKVFVTKAEGQLLAVDAWPLVDGRKDETRGERMLLLDLRERDGLLVPHELRHLFRLPDASLRQQTMARLLNLELRPKLGVDDFDRTRK